MALMSAVLHPGITELEVAQAHEALARKVAPLLGPMICDIMFVQLRRAVEGEELNASERAAGTALPGARLLAVAFADMVGFTRLGEAVPPEDLVRLVERSGRSGAWNRESRQCDWSRRLATR